MLKRNEKNASDDDEIEAFDFVIFLFRERKFENKREKLNVSYKNKRFENERTIFRKTKKIVS